VNRVIDHEPHATEIAFVTSNVPPGRARQKLEFASR